MKKRLVGMLVVIMCIISFSLAYAEKARIPCYMPVLEAWNAKDGEELETNILEYWRTNAEDWATSIYESKKRFMTFRLGGTTKELIADHKEWDIAIVSSKDVDLQQLADEGVIIHHSYEPTDLLCLNHWLLPDAVRQKLPVHPLFEYAVYCYDYNNQTDEAIFIICNDKDRPAGSREGWSYQILKRRGVEQVRALEGICVVNDWTQEGVNPRTPDELIQRSEEWDWASIRIGANDKLEALDQAGLLYDFSQDAYWAGREEAWPEPKGIFSSDGRMIGIPYNPIITGEYESNTVLLFIVNAKSEHCSQALAYAKHFIKSYEWLYDAIKTGSYENPDIVKKYGEHSICIYKDDVDW